MPYCSYSGPGVWNRWIAYIYASAALLSSPSTSVWATWTSPFCSSPRTACSTRACRPRTPSCCSTRSHSCPHPRTASTTTTTDPASPALGLGPTGFARASQRGLLRRRASASRPSGAEAGGGRRTRTGLGEEKHRCRLRDRWGWRRTRRAGSGEGRRPGERHGGGSALRGCG